MNSKERAQVHAALGDPARLDIVDALQWSDRTFNELARIAGLPGNAVAHHLGVLEAAGLIDRHISEGDRRRRYVRLRHQRLEAVVPDHAVRSGPILFVCTHNSARSQFAAALWTKRTGRRADSAGTQPAAAVHPWAVIAAGQYGVDLRGALPKGYEAVAATPDLVISVCDRAFEAGTPFDAPTIHWSVADPVPIGTPQAFDTAFADVAARINRLAAGLAA